MNDSRRLRVALLTTAFPRWANDSRGPSMFETARGLRDQDVDVRVVTLHGPGALARETMESIPVYRTRYLWPERLERLQDVGGGLPAAWRAGWAYRLGFVPMFVALIWAAIRHGRVVDVIHAHWTLAGWAAWLASFVTGTPFVLTVHGSDIYIAPGIPGVAAFTRGMLRGCARVLAVSRDLADATASLGYPRERVEVIPDGIDLDRFTPGGPDREPLLLFVGSLIQRKGVHYLLQAMPAIRERCPGVRLAIVGDGPERDALTRQAVELGVADVVDFVGAQSQAQIATWMQRARLFVLPSQEEALGIVLLEALASGTPCVASRVGGIPDIVAEDVGRLVPPRAAAALADVVTAVLTDLALWRRLHERAREHVEQNCWTWRRVATRLAVIYAEVRR